MSSQAMRQFEEPAALQGGERPIDLVHLSRQTLGDRELEVELLGLFERQALQIMERLASATGERSWRRDLAHTLKGSARAIGATKVAATAQVYETAMSGPISEASAAGMLADLRAAVVEARAFALDFLADA